MSWQNEVIFNFSAPKYRLAQCHIMQFYALNLSLLSFSVQNFALGKGDEEVITTLQSFAKTVVEVRPVFAVLLFYVCIFWCVCVCTAEDRDDRLLHQ